MNIFLEENNIFNSDYTKEKNFTYTGRAEKIILYPGQYRFDLYGANGGYSHGGKGGHVAASIIALKKTELFLYIGGAGKVNSGSEGGEGGWNGGGKGGARYKDYLSGGGGGGATDVRTVDGEWNENLEKRIIVAGGGGGGSGHKYLYGGDGGGLDGGNSFQNGYDISCKEIESSGGKIVSGFAFGYGQAGKDGIEGACKGEGSGGGGSGWFGGSTRNDDTQTIGGGGGSGFASPIFINPVFEAGKNYRSDGNGYIIIKIEAPLPTKVCRNSRRLIAVEFMLFMLEEFAVS